ncbi:N-carbamoylsarcosine amidase [Iodidimonas nitroreducens]|uniref:N-carbamoylsarcosine amidase n=1 Tax=Iodidimonas nitroreducens TaxID=1236968 RepID=A0A5A7N9R8_9PROT|nr:isochorismatase family protein [Iodidimonas nitroreducens]GAK34573.1 maleamate amidohydrolase [alpha proteobacterium Q-1]GER04375.1 N-carbamoylsarcosine amidase [Iodidimonas nitroreducens]
MTTGGEKDLATDYAAAGFGNALGLGRRPALLVVDIVRAYLDPASPLFAGVDDAVAAAARLVEAAREARIPVIFTHVRYRPGGADGGLFYRKVGALHVFDAGSPLGDFPERPAPRADEVVITKQYASAFFGTSLASTLRAMGVDSCYICGLTTSGCVRATALDALQNGFIPLVVPEACGDRDARVQEANLFDLGQKYADIVPIDAALDAFQSFRSLS